VGSPNLKGIHQADNVGSQHFHGKGAAWFVRFANASIVEHNHSEVLPEG
jgi:hypothetical protein